jgi:hypothetical protein
MRTEDRINLLAVAQRVSRLTGNAEGDLRGVDFDDVLGYTRRIRKLFHVALAVLLVVLIGLFYR